MAKIAVEVSAGNLARRLLARGEGWSVSEVLCTSGPRDQAFEEQHSTANIAIVLSGTFQYRSSIGSELMTPGSLLLGNLGQYFECGHEHAAGDHCVSFSFDRHYLDELATEAKVPTRTAPFSALRVPPVRELTGLVTRASACAGDDGAALEHGEKYGLALRPWSGSSELPMQEDRRFDEWQEIAIELASRALELSSGRTPRPTSSPAAEARVTRVVRTLENRPEEVHDLAGIAREAKLSRYHFLRLFQQLTGLTPHQYLLRVRLRRAATRLLRERTTVLEIALESGFADLSNFNHRFRAEFGVSPRAFRREAASHREGSPSIAPDFFNRAVD